MDPQVTWSQMLDALNFGEFEAAADLAVALQQWLNRGGFPPLICGKDWPGVWPDLDQQLARSACRYALAQADPSHPHPEEP